MQLTKGYKQTEVGVIPEDWLEHTIGDLISFSGGSQPDKSYFSPVKKPGHVRLIQIRDYKTEKYITFVPECLARKFCDSNDIMIGRYGPPVFQILRGLDGAYNVALIKASPNNHVSRRYAYYYLKRDELFQLIEKLSRRSSGQTGVDLVELKAYPFPLPPTRAEQEAVAGALSDADAWIESLEQLIAKKRRIKEGASQALLTGKQRLPGFSGEWEVKTFDEIFNFHSTATNSRSDLIDGGDTYYIHYGDIHTKFHSHLDFEVSTPPKLPRSKCKNATQLQNGDWIMADASEDYDGVGKTIEVLGLKDDTKAVSGLHTFLLREKKPTYVSGFKGHLGNLKSLHESYLQVATGMKVYGVSKTALRDIELPIPKPAEQTAIAAILSDMDSELDALESKLSKARQIKQGMMQELLTGKTRLV